MAPRGKHDFLANAFVAAYKKSVARYDDLVAHSNDDVRRQVSGSGLCVALLQEDDFNQQTRQGYYGYSLQGRYLEN